MAIALKYKSQPSPAHRCVIYIFLQNKLWNKISEILFLKPSDSKGKYCSQHWGQPDLLLPKLWLAGWVQGLRRTSKTSDVPAVVQHLLSSSEWWASLWFDTSNKHNYFLFSVFHQWGFGSRPAVFSQISSTSTRVQRRRVLLRSPPASQHTALCRTNLPPCTTYTWFPQNWWRQTERANRGWIRECELPEPCGYCTFSLTLLPKQDFCWKTGKMHGKHASTQEPQLRCSKASFENH